MLQQVMWPLYSYIYCVFPFPVSCICNNDIFVEVDGGWGVATVSYIGFAPGKITMIKCNMTQSQILYNLVGYGDSIF